MHTRGEPAAEQAQEVEPHVRRTPDAPAQRILSLQHTAGNAAVSRVLGGARLQRLRKQDETKHLQLGYAIEDIEHYRTLLLATQQRWNEYHHQEYLPLRLAAEVDPLIAELKTLRADVEAEDSPDAKLAKVPGLIKRALAALKQLNDEGQDQDKKSVPETYVKGNADRKARMQKELSDRAAAAAAQDLLDQAAAAALAVQTAISNTGVVPNDVGPAFAMPGGAGERDDLHTWITLSWQPFRNLPRHRLNDPLCFVYWLPKAQIEMLIGRLGTQVVTEYAYQGWPGTRAALVGGTNGLVVPVKISGMTAEFGAEIVIDWIVHNPGHTAPAERLVDSFNFTGDEARFTQFGGTVTRTPGRIRYEYNAGRRLVVNAARTSVITYYNGGG
jgi:hypothetical protein